ncbi:MAG: patatin-like phospholipase family protein [Myxococcota bacterium]
MREAGSLVLRAGARATERLREQGLHADLFDTLVGASGGPKWLVLRALDEVLIERLVVPRRRPLDTLGSSIGSFRHACLAQRDARSALTRFAEAYVEQAYQGVPTQETISAESERILACLLGDAGAVQIASNDVVRSHFVATRLRRDRGLDRGRRFQLQLAAAAGWNALGRHRLGRAVERIVFGPEKSPIAFRDLPTTFLPLTADALGKALLASGSIPLVMAGVRDAPGRPGLLFDGGLIDYHFDFAFRRGPGLVLFPHFFDRITPGWFDRFLPWRYPRARDLEDVVLIAPSDAFIASLPGEKVPDRNDFLALPTAERIRRWRQVLDRSRRLADELDALFATPGGDLPIRPLPR